MGAVISYLDYEGLLEIVRRWYEVDAERMELHRHMIGHVYFVHGRACTYVLKLYRHFHTDNALTSIGVIKYLTENTYPVVPIIPARTVDPYIWVDCPGGRCVAILYKYVQGVEPNIETEITHIGQQVGWLHELMKGYPNPLPRRGKAFYIDRYISLLKQLEYPPAKIRELEALGERLWNVMALLPAGFCHGDLHTGNMLQTGPGVYVLMDLDVASKTHSVIDVASLCDGTDFNNLSELGYDRTVQRLTAFYEGYSRHGTLGAADADLEAVTAFIAIRHFELIATITACQEHDRLSRRFLDEQYEWLLNWEGICKRRRG